MNRIKVITKALHIMASKMVKTPKPLECPYKIEAPTPPNEYGHFPGDRWDHALSRLWRTGLI